MGLKTDHFGKPVFNSYSQYNTSIIDTFCVRTLRYPAQNIEWEILYACRGVEKLMRTEEIYFKKLKQQLNTLDV